MTQFNYDTSTRQGQPEMLPRPQITAADERQNLEFVQKMLIPMYGSNALHNIFLLVTIVLGWLAVSVEVFIRRGFGIRYLGPVRLLVGSMALGAYFWIAGAMNPGWLNWIALTVLWFGFLGISLFHVVKGWWDFARGVQWHSRSFGISHLRGLIGKRVWRFKIDDWVLYTFIEPPLVIAAGFVMALVIPSLAGWLILGGLALWLKNLLLWNYEWEQMLDMRDSAITAEYRGAAAAGRPKQEAGGISMVTVPQAAMPVRASVPLDEAVDRAMQSP